MSANAGSPDRSAPSRGLWAVVIVVLLACVATYFVFEARRRQKQEECERLTAQLNEAVGYLEAGQFDKADGALSALARMFPKEPAAVRNLAICRVLAILQPQKPGEAEPSPSLAQSALDAARSLEPRSHVPHVLAARLAANQQDAATAVAELRAAGNVAADDPAIWYDLYVVGESAADDELRNQALDSALKVAPKNSWLLKQQLLSQTKRKDRQALETLKTLRAQIEPIVAAVKVHARGADVDEYARRLADAVEKENWQQAHSQANFINNVIKAEEWVRSDLRRLNRHPLTHVVHDFSPAVCGPSPPGPGNDQPRTTVTFQAAPAPNQLPQRAGIKALNLSDFDLDGLPDAVALTEKELAVISRAGADAPWETLLAVPVRDPMNKVLVADLDRDLRSGAKPIAERADAAREANESATGNSTCQAGDVEIVVLGPGGVQIFRNDVDENGKRTLVPIEQTEAFEALRDIRGGVLADIDHDGDLDLILSAGGGVSMWLNEGQLKFEEA
ncbi:MAG: FG-GAP-like repeat-containing protein, partial [Deltaproteobacteria bacterium]